MWDHVCEELNIKDAYFHVRNNLFFEFLASMAVLSVVLEMMVGRRSGLVRTNSGLEGYRAENLGPILPLPRRHRQKEREII